MPEPVLAIKIQRIDRGVYCETQDIVAVEEPLEISIDGRNISITMRTPGND